MRLSNLVKWGVMAWTAVMTPCLVTSAYGQRPTDPENAAAPPVTVETVLTEPRFIGRGIDMAIRIVGDASADKSGFYVDALNMISGAGWISGGPGYRRWLGGDRYFIDASAAVSWRGYKLVQSRFEVTNLARSRVALGTQFRWQDFTQITYFGDGPDSQESDRSEYRIDAGNVVGYMDYRPARWITVGARTGWLREPTLLPPDGPFQRNYPDARETFPQDPAYALSEQPSYLHGDILVTADSRDYRSHPTRGGVYRGMWSRYSDRQSGQFSFERFEAEAAQFIPVGTSPVTLGLHGWLVASDTADGRSVPFYLLPSLGGNYTLRGYSNYRFHDRNLALINAEIRVALLAHIDVAVFGDFGNVANRMADLNLDKSSVGVGVRMHSVRSTFARLDVAHGAEGWRVIFNTNDPLHLSRLSRRMAAIPFVP